VIRVDCPRCRKKHLLADGMLGKQVKCSCGVVFTPTENHEFRSLLRKGAIAAGIGVFILVGVLLHPGNAARGTARYATGIGVVGLGIVAGVGTAFGLTALVDRLFRK